MGLYHNRLQAPTKTLAADWIPEEGELFRDSAGNLYCGDNVTASNVLTPVSNGAQGVKRYVALLSQSGADAPVATVLENSLGGAVVWTYDATGEYLATLAGAFTANKTTCMIAPVAAFANLFTAERLSDNTVLVSGSGDDALINRIIEITVYP